MNAIEMLTGEHRLIEATLEAMLMWNNAVQRRQAGGEQSELRRFVAFLREFVDDCHHGKEEQVLFPRLKACGMSPPVMVMLDEHEQGRGLIASLDALAHSARDWTDEERAQVGDLTLTYTALMRQHIRKEDTVLYPIAGKRLGASELDELGRKLECFEQTEIGGRRHEQLRRFAASLVAAHPADPEQFPSLAPRNL